MTGAILTGALLAGDSVRGSLREIAFGRLGQIESATVSESFFREALAAELGKDVAPAVVTRASAVNAATRARASRVALQGVDARFGALFPGSALPDLAARGPGQLFASVAINASLARELGAKAGDDLLLSFARPGEIPADVVVGERDADDRLASRRFTVTAVLPDSGLGSFGLSAQQTAPRNAFVALPELQKDLEREGQVNALFSPRQVTLPRERLRLEDFGLRLVPHADHLALESREYFLKEAVVDAAEAFARERKIPTRRVLTYLATRLERPGKLIPYSLVSALSELPGGAPGDGEIVLNRWAAEDLAVAPGDPVQLSYLILGESGGLLTRQVSLKLRGVIEMSGLGAERALTPAFPGLDDAEHMADWDPPFPVDLQLIRPQDEDYWDRYRAAPKAFVSEATGRKLWSTRFGRQTAVRFEPADPAALAALAADLGRELPRRIDPERFGLAPRPIRALAEQAAGGTTDFSGLLLAFSFFLIVSALLLVGLLFSLGIERRAGELGLLLGVGFPLRAVRRRLLGEGLILAAAGAALGVLGGVGYAALLMAGLRTWWLPAVGTPQLHLFVTPGSLLLGFLLTVVAVLAAIAGTVRRLSRIPAPRLLAGAATAPARAGRRGRRSRWIFRLFGGLALVLLLAALATSRTASPGLAFGIGACGLIAGLSLFALRLRRSEGRPVGSLFGMAARNGAANPGRSLLAVALIASASFLLVIVAANRGGVHAESGAGGFALWAESDVPLVRPLAEEVDDPALSGLPVVPFRLLPGDEASCLNLLRPGRPRLLGVPADRKALHGFRFRRALDLPAGGDPWSLLDRDLGPGVVPVIADENSAQWILHLPLGQDLEMADESGRPLQLRLVAILEKGLLQSELLVSEAQLLRHFPSRSGWSFFLLAPPAARAGEVAQTLEAALGRYGFDVQTTAERIAAYQAVEETYLSTFQTLGGLGLLLGTLGLGVALLRSVLERRGELAVLRACGFRRRRLAVLVTAENAVLLGLGLLLGTVSGLLASAPRLLAAGGELPWSSLGLTLLAVAAAGLFACWAAVRSALAAPLLPALKEER